MSEGSNVPFQAAPLGVRSHAVPLWGSTRPPGFLRLSGLSRRARPTEAHGQLRGCRPGRRRRCPGATGRGAILGRFERIDQNGYPYDVRRRRHEDRKPLRHDAIYRVQLPVAPNGSTGWVAAWAVRLLVVHTRIEVSLRAHRLVVYRNGKVAFRARIAVGTPDTPTPTGDFFVNERFVLANSSGPFGVAALGISAHSTVLKNWVQGGPDRNSRHERADADRRRRLARLHQALQQRHDPALQAGAGGHAGRSRAGASRAEQRRRTAAPGTPRALRPCHVRHASSGGPPAASETTVPNRWRTRLTANRFGRSRPFTATPRGSRGCAE